MRVSSKRAEQVWSRPWKRRRTGAGHGFAAVTGGGEEGGEQYGAAAGGARASFPAKSALPRPAVWGRRKERADAAQG